jgi:hypothetical protein
MLMNHQLKMWPEYFQVAWVGDKPFEIRKNDRNFKERDEITLAEYDPLVDDYTGREIHGIIDYVTTFEQKENFVVFSYKEIGRAE